MTRIVWSQVGERFFETGVDQGVLYPPNGAPGVPWNGLISVEEGVSGGEVEPYYFDGLKYLDFVLNEDFQATLTAFSAPVEFATCEGLKALAPGLSVAQQPRLSFGLCYRTRIGNDVDGVDHGFKLHLVYNATAAPTGRVSSTLNDSPEPSQLSWTIESVPPPATTYKPGAHFIIDSREVDSEKLATLEDALYGTFGAGPGTTATLPPQATVITMLS